MIPRRLRNRTERPEQPEAVQLVAWDGTPVTEVVIYQPTPVLASWRFGK